MPLVPSIAARRDLFLPLHSGESAPGEVAVQRQGPSIFARVLPEDKAIFDARRRDDALLWSNPVTARGLVNQFVTDPATWANARLCRG